MKKHKIISLLIAVIYLLQFIPAVYAGDVLTVTSPKDGSTVSCETNVFELIPPDGKAIVKTLFTLDGKFLGNGDESGMYAYDGALSVGSHSLEAIALYDDGTAEKAISNFTAAILPESATVDFEHVTPEEYTDSESAVAAIKSLKLINGGIYNSTNLGKVAVEEEEGYGKVLKIKTTTARMLVGGAYLHVYANPTLASDGTAVNTAVKSGKVGIEFDVWLPYSSKGGEITQLTITPYQTSGANLKSVNLAINNKILDTYTITPGWFKVSMIYDLDNLVCYGTITDVDEDTTWEVPEAQIADSAVNISDYRIGARIEKENYWAIDNIKTGMIGNYTGITEIRFKDEADPEADSDGYVNAANKPVNRYTSEFVVKTDKALSAGSVNTDNISVTAAGKALTVTDAVWNADDNSIAITVDNSDGIDGNGESYIELSENIAFADGTAAGVKARSAFDLTPSGFVVKNVDFSNGDTSVFSASQLSDGDKIKAQITISNADPEPAALTAVLAVKSGKKFVSLTFMDITAEGENENYTASIESSPITNADDITASVIFVNNLSDAYYIASEDLK